MTQDKQPDPLQPLLDQLDGDPRVFEHLWLDTRGLDDAAIERARALALSLLDAGDPRAASLTAALWPRHDRRALLEARLATSHASAAIAIARELHALHGTALRDALLPGLLAGHMTSSSMGAAARLLIEAGQEAALIAALDAPALPHPARAAIAISLWDARRLGQFGSPWWCELGQLRLALTIPIPSLRDPALTRLKALLSLGPAHLGLTAPPWEELPPALRRELRAVDRADAPDPDALAALTPLLRRALLLYAADNICDARAHGGLAYVALIGGVAHVDVLDWAQQHPDPKLQLAAAQARALLAP